MTLNRTTMEIGYTHDGGSVFYSAYSIDAGYDNDEAFALGYHTNDGMPAHRTDTFATLPELEAAMQEIAPLSAWREVEEDECED